MHELFADWLAVVDPEPTAERLARRWEQVEAVVSTAEPSQCLGLVGIHLNLPNADEAKGQLAQVCKQTDPTFKLRGNEVLLQVMAGSALAQVIASRGSGALLASLALRSAHCQGLRVPPAFPDVVEAAHAFLQTRSREVRAVSSARRPELKKLPGAPALAAFDATVQPNQWGQIQEGFNAAKASIDQLRTAVTSLHAALISLRDDSAAALRTTDPRIPVLQEETDILWWLFGEFTHDLGLPLGGLDAHAACLAVGAELSKRTHVLPGPAMADAFLVRALRPTKEHGETTLQEVVNARPSEWRPPSAGKSTPTPVTPIHLALSKAIDSPGDDSWLAGFRAASDLDPATVRLSPAQWSRQMYDECLLMRVMES